MTYGEKTMPLYLLTTKETPSPALVKFVDQEAREQIAKVEKDLAELEEAVERQAYGENQ